MRVTSRAALLVCVFLPLYGDNRSLGSTIESIQAAIESGDRPGASRLLSEALAQHPREAGLFNLRGIVHAQQQELAAARADFQQAVRLAPALTPAWQNLGRACQLLSESDSSAMACAAGAWEHVLRALPSECSTAGCLIDAHSHLRQALADLLQPLVLAQDSQRLCHRLVQRFRGVPCWSCYARPGDHRNRADGNRCHRRR